MIIHSSKPDDIKFPLSKSNDLRWNRFKPDEVGDKPFISDDVNFSLKKEQ